MSGMNLIMPIGQNMQLFKGAIILNDTSAFIFEKMIEGLSSDEIAQCLVDTFVVDIDKANYDIEKIYKQLVEVGIAE